MFKFVQTILLFVTLATAKVIRWSSGTNMLSLTQATQNSIILFVDAKEQDLRMIFEEASALDEKWCNDQEEPMRPWIVVDKKQLMQDPTNFQGLPLASEIYKKGSQLIAKASSEYAVLNWTYSRAYSQTELANQLQADIRNRLDKVKSFQSEIGCYDIDEVLADDRHSFVIFSRLPHPLWEQLVAKERITYTKERANMLHVSDPECIKSFNFNTSKDAYTIVFYPGWHRKESAIHVGSIEADLNDPKGAKHLIDYLMAIAYQKRTLIMSAHAEHLKAKFNYPVVELHLDTDSIADDSVSWLVKTFRQAMTADDCVLLHF